MISQLQVVQLHLYLNLYNLWFNLYYLHINNEVLQIRSILLDEVRLQFSRSQIEVVSFLGSSSKSTFYTDD